MDSITEYLTADHRRCDEHFARAEAGAAEGNWSMAASHLSEFERLLERHFAMEEQVLFPAFEQATGSTQGPTAVMRIEHAHIRELIAALKDAQAAGAREDFLGCADTLNTLIQQHNMKEEGILYQMTDRLLASRRVELVREMAGIEP